MGLFKKSATVAKKPSIEWPAINELLWIRLPCCETAIHPSRVEGTDGDSLIVAHPSLKPHLRACALTIIRTFDSARMA